MRPLTEHRAAFLPLLMVAAGCLLIHAQTGSLVISL